MSITSRRYCSVPQCNTYCSKDISLHLFPHKNPELCRAWATALKIGKPVSSSMMVCSQHFKEEDFTIASRYGFRRRLKIGAVPSQKIPTGSHDRLPAPARSERLQGSSILNVNDDVLQTEIAHSGSESHELEIQKELETIQEATSILPEPITKLLEDKECQTNTLTNLMRSYKLMDNLNTDKNLSAFTGINVNTFNAIKCCCFNVLQYNEIPSPLNLETKILVLIKLKLAISFRCISILLDISETSCRRYFHDVVPILKVAVQSCIYWPNKEENLKNMPICFNNYRSTRVVLDCSEVPVQKSPCLKCRIRLYSYYKGRYTMKFLLGVTPSGLICFVSRAYGGRASDKAIFNREKFIHLMEPYEAIMVDKGVLIEEECAKNLIKLIRPPFLRSQKQFSKADAEQTASIASARVHVERTIQRMKIFAILNSTIDWFILPYMDDILIIIGALLFKNINF